MIGRYIQDAPILNTVYKIRYNIGFTNVWQFFVLVLDYEKSIEYGMLMKSDKVFGSLLFPMCQTPLVALLREYWTVEHAALDATNCSL